MVHAHCWTGRRCADPATAWRNAEAPGRRFNLRAQAVDDLGGGDFALRQRLERDVDEAGIGRPAAAGKGDDIVDAQDPS